MVYSCLVPLAAQFQLGLLSLYTHGTTVEGLAKWALREKRGKTTPIFSPASRTEWRLSISLLSLLLQALGGTLCAFGDDGNSQGIPREWMHYVLSLFCKERKDIPCKFYTYGTWQFCSYLCFVQGENIKSSSCSLIIYFWLSSRIITRSSSRMASGTRNIQNLSQQENISVIPPAAPRAVKPIRNMSSPVC